MQLIVIEPELAVDGLSCIIVTVAPLLPLSVKLNDLSAPALPYWVALIVSPLFSVPAVAVRLKLLFAAPLCPTLIVLAAPLRPCMVAELLPEPC